MKLRDFTRPLYEDDYRMDHQAPGKNDGAPLWNLTGNEIYPDDVYANLRDYTFGDTGSDILSKLYHFQNKPNAMVTIYRAVPHEPTPDQQINQLEKQLKQYMARNIVPASYAGGRPSEWYELASNELERLKQLPPVASKRLPINPGDWITLSKRYANEHGRSNLGGKFKVVTKKVFARDVYTDGNSLDEWGYDPTPRVEGYGVRGPYQDKA